MLRLLWDASALAKRYALELGSDAVDALFDEIPRAQMATTFLGYAETYSVLLRRRNRGDITEPTFRSAASLLQAEVVDSADFGLLTVSDIAILSGIEQMEKHNLNAADSAILSAYLAYAGAQVAFGTRCLLIASDQRFIRAGQAEGLRALNPEMHAAAAIATFLAAL